MPEAPGGTPVGVEDPYAHVERCDHLTDDGACRFAVERPEEDRSFARERANGDYACPVADPEGDWDWADCPHFCSRATDRECERCGLAGRRMAHGDERPLLEEHHLSYAESSGEYGDGGDGAEAGPAHEVTVYLCRWCHAKVHRSWARLDDDVEPDPEALAAREQRRSRELAEAAFESARERYRE